MRSSEAAIWEIRIKGHLGRQWTDWFDGLTITLEADGDTRLIGSLPDQAALHGVLRKLRDLAMPLRSVTCSESTRSATTADTEDS
jgi:hypothetical protein